MNKKVFIPILRKSQFNYQNLVTLLTEIEAVHNLRPLSFIYDEHDEPRPLTPMHFINFDQNQQTYLATFVQIIESGSDRSSHLKRKRYQMILLKQIWTQWK